MYIINVNVKPIRFSLYVRVILMQQIWEQFDLRNIFAHIYFLHCVKKNIPKRNVFIIQICYYL